VEVPDGAAFLECSVLLFELAEGEAESEEGGCSFADQDAPSVGSVYACAGFGFEASDPGETAEADGSEGGEVGPARASSGGALPVRLS
jgi:hypothetical protein